MLKEKENGDWWFAGVMSEGEEESPLGPQQCFHIVPKKEVSDFGICTLSIQISMAAPDLKPQ